MHTFCFFINPFASLALCPGASHPKYNDNFCQHGQTMEANQPKFDPMALIIKISHGSLLLWC